MQSNRVFLFFHTPVFYYRGLQSIIELVRSLLIFSILILAFFALKTPALAVTERDGDLEVTYNSPLFGSDIIWYPGLSVTRSFSIHNHGGKSHTAQIRANNTSETGNLADVLYVKFSKDGTVIYGDGDSKTIGNFWNDGTIDLLKHNPGNKFAYNMTINFASSAGNGYQEKEVKFDLIVNFPGIDGGEVTIEGGEAGGDGETGEGGAAVTTTIAEGATTAESELVIAAGGFGPAIAGAATEAEEKTEKISLPREKGEVAGVACPKPFPWWAPLIIQLVVTFGYSLILGKKERTLWWAAPVVLVIASQIVHEILGCECIDSPWCPRYWMLNLLIFASSSLYYKFRIKLT